MKISLPQSEDRWSASSAQRWASFPLPPVEGGQSPHTLEDLGTDGSWITAWKTTGVLGKQVIIQLLANIVMSDHGRELARNVDIDRDGCKAVLLELLSATEEESVKPSVPELKAWGLYQLSILSALMMCHIPPLPLLSSALQLKYRRSSCKEPGNTRESWNSEPQTRRLAVVYAARVFGSIRDHPCTHFSSPVFLFRATLLLWIYDVLCTPQQQQDSASAPSRSPTVILGIPDTNTVDQVRKAKDSEQLMHMMPTPALQRFVLVDGVQGKQRWGGNYQKPCTS
ncbi:hypothetical protein CNMCM5623_001939 [Aspergillus felis]|uniref:Uncharacterized protein n=1 Tax=Aspergillus felis TaxID=1287682 RepID=A0A8H6UW66_9EURO|nr:hypothetical protein CNMCM5623_001939 [Aspergillus felis]